MEVITSNNGRQPWTMQGSQPEAPLSDVPLSLTPRQWEVAGPRVSRVWRGAHPVLTKGSVAGGAWKESTCVTQDLWKTLEAALVAAFGRKFICGSGIPPGCCHHFAVCFQTPLRGAWARVRGRVGKAQDASAALRRQSAILGQDDKGGKADSWLRFGMTKSFRMTKAACDIDHRLFTRSPVFVILRSL